MKQIKKQKFTKTNNRGDITNRGLLETISTAVLSLICSQRPSDANIKNKSCGFSFLISIDGSAVITGLFKGKGNPNG
jgi:hypothetical protein